MTDRERASAGREREHPWRRGTRLIGQLEAWLASDLIGRLGFEGHPLANANAFKGGLFKGGDFLPPEARRPRVVNLVYKYTDIAGNPVYEATIAVRGETIRKDFSVVAAGPGDKGHKKVTFGEPAAILDGELPETDLDSLESQHVPGRVHPNMTVLADDIVRQFQQGNLDPHETAFLLRNMPGQQRISQEQAEAIVSGEQGQSSGEEGPSIEEFIASLIEGQGGGGGGGPRYTAPDRSLVEDGVRGMLVQLIGHVDPSRLNQLTDLWMREDLRRFRGASTDPTQAVKNMIRGYDEYKRIHALRPEQVDDADWITSQAARLMSAGVRNEAIDERAVIQAQVGTPLASAGEAAAISEIQQTRRPMPSFFRRFSDAARAGMRRVV